MQLLLSFLLLVLPLTSSAIDVTLTDTPDNSVPVTPHFASLAVEYFGIDELFLSAPYLPPPTPSKLATELPKRLNLAVLQLIRNLGQVNGAEIPAVLRIGGNSANRIYLPSSPQQRIFYQDIVIREYEFQILNVVAKLTGCKLIFTIGMPTPTPRFVPEIAMLIRKNIDASHLLAIQVGNEPDHASLKGIRPPEYTYAEYVKEFEAYVAVVKQYFGDVALMGPNFAFQLKPDWLHSDFVAQKGGEIKYMGFHRYALRGCSDSTSLDALLDGMSLSFWNDEY